MSSLAQYAKKPQTRGWPAECRNLTGNTIDMKSDTKILRSLVLLGLSLHELMKINGDCHIVDLHGKAHDYVVNEVLGWLQKRYPTQENFSEEVIHKTIKYLITQNLLTNEDEFAQTENYHSDLYIINTNEKKYADKHIGTSFRDNGSFGSLPLYDDYSEESDF